MSRVTYPTNIVFQVRGRRVVITHPARRAPWWLHLPSRWDGPTPNLRQNSLGGYAFRTRLAASDWVAAQKSDGEASKLTDPATLVR